MARHFSIRRRLGLQAVFTGAVMLCLAVAFVWAQQATDRAFLRVVESEMLPAIELRAIGARLQSIHTRIQSVLLGQASALGALELLLKERPLLLTAWETFRRDHRNWLEDPDEDALIADIESALPTLLAFLDDTERAYERHDREQLSHLAETGWYQLQQSLIQNLQALSALQEQHALTATQRLERSILHIRLAVSAVLGTGLLCLGFFSVHLGRHIMQRIVGIEQALDAIARGEQSVQIPYLEGESEMARIASAINRTIAQIADDRLALTALMRQLQTVLNSVAEGIYGVDGEGRIMFINPAALIMLGYQDIEVIGQTSHSLFHHHHADGRPYALTDCPIARSRQDAHVEHRDDEVFFRKNGSSFPVEYTSAPLLMDSERAAGGVVIFHDITERREHERLLKETVTQLRDTNARLAETQVQLIQAEKLAGLGQLAAGVAHEMNNPLAFVNSNFATLETYVHDLLNLIEGYEGVIAATEDSSARATATRLRESTDLDFLRDDLRALIRESRQGLQRVGRIVGDLKDFSRIDSSPAEWGDVNLNHCLDATLKVVAGAIGEKAEVVRDYATLPPVRGNAVQLNQIFLNILLNAVHAIDHHGTITLRTWCRLDEVCVEIADTGCGMAPDVSDRMFDPFYTTRPIGQGTGLGLSVAYSIAQKHGGRFEVDSTQGQGTSVRLWLPIGDTPAG
ncbi:ATP-binding protein [Aromatoleum petrolei]|uniref:histidine kinase n=1 Tax=Aromatoleum petrolei TaxID=76116 RepID=A0ABX1MJR5_9RHOO|nr:ATP-binding protein [Aromatoleum petrolei]NMF88205.1 PAS domain S-box protein [Aromatoleum petrolei]QTQ38936.1 Signal transduction histidine kinase, PAS domain-containing [Aromatoleum petrolei]